MEWSLNPKVQGDVAAWFGSVPAVPAACKGNELLTETGCATNGFDNFDKISLLAHAGSRVQHGHVRALQPLGDRLCRGDGRPLSGGTGLERAALHGGCRVPNPQST